MILPALLSTAILAASVLANGFASVPKTYHKNSTALSLCELIQNTAHYDRQLVSVKAFYLVGAEQAVLYDPQCRGGEYLTFVDFSKLKGKFPAKLRQLEKTDRRALVIFEGTFYGLEPLEIDPQLPQNIKDKLAGAKRRYGHMDSLETMIQVTCIKQVQKITGNVPN